MFDLLKPDQILRSSIKMLHIIFQLHHVQRTGLFCFKFFMYESLLYFVILDSSCFKIEFLLIWLSLTHLLLCLIVRFVCSQEDSRKAAASTYLIEQIEYPFQYPGYEMQHQIKEAETVGLHRNTYAHNG